jgi:hypothetical protein
MVRLGMGVLLAIGVLAGCRAEKFVSPDKPDLYKVPYDFAPAVDHGAGVDLASSDLASADLAVVDLASPDDLSDQD